MSNSNSPCAACKHLRRRCVTNCFLAPYFPAEDYSKYLSVHKVYGTSNMVQLLMAIEERYRAEAVKSFIYEAQLREKDPTYGVVREVYIFQEKLRRTLKELAAGQQELATYLGPGALSPVLPGQKQLYSHTGDNMKPSHAQQMAAIQPQQQHEHQGQQYHGSQEILQNQQQQQENFAKSNVGFGEVGGLSSNVSSFNQFLIHETQQTHEQQQQQLFDRQQHDRQMQFPMQQEFTQKQQQQQETFSMKPYLPLGGSHEIQQHANDQFQQDHSFPQPTDQFQQDHGFPQPTDQFQQDHGFPQPTDQFQQDHSFPQPTDQFQQDHSFPQRIDQFQQDHSFPQRTDQFQQDHSFPQPTDQFQQNHSFPQPTDQFQQDHSFPKPTDQFQQGVTIDYDHDSDQAHGLHSQIQGQQFLQSQERLFAMEQQKHQQHQENLPKFNDGFCEVGGPSTAPIQPYSTLGGLNVAQSLFHPHSYQQQRYDDPLQQLYHDQLLQQTNILNILEVQPDQLGQVQGTHSEKQLFGQSNQLDQID